MPEFTITLPSSSQRKGGVMPFGLKIKSKSSVTKVASKKVDKKAKAKVAETKSKLKEKKTDKKLSPLEKARLAKAAGKKAGATKRTRKPTIDFLPPSDFKPFMIDLHFKTTKDALLGPEFRIERVRGRWDNEDAKRWDMMDYDSNTVTAFLSRFGGLMFAPNVDKRLGKNTAYRIIFRVSLRKMATSDTKKKLGVSIVAIARYKKSEKTGKLKPSWLTDGKDPDRRRIRRAAKHLAGAFTNVLLPPVARRTRRNKSDED